MISLEIKISRHAKDLIQKYASGLFRDASLEFFGVKTAKIKEIISVELPAIEVSGSVADFVFLLEDGTYLHFEFQSTYNEKDLIRFAGYDLRLYERDGRKVITVIIYTADVKHTGDGVDIGSLTYAPARVMMVGYDGDTIYKELTSKIEAGQDITDLDMLNLIFLPLMRNSINKVELAVKSIQLAKNIPDAVKRNACIASAFAFANRYLSGFDMKKLRGAIKMTDLIVWLFEDEFIEVAKKLLKRGISAEAVAEDTGLDEDTVRKLQAELNEAV